MPAYPKAYEQAIAFTSKWEGGLSDHEADLGGLTNMGITQGFWDANYIAGYPKSVVDLTAAQAKAIYYECIWSPTGCEVFKSPALAIVHFDTSVNFGISGGIQFLQEALGIPMDGDWGATTQSALDKFGDQDKLAGIIVGKRIAYRRQRVKEDPSQEVFLAGWLNRDRDLQMYISNLSAPVQNSAPINESAVKITPSKLRDFIMYFDGLLGQSKGIKALLQSVDVEQLYKIIPPAMLVHDAQWMADYRNNPAPVPAKVTTEKGYILLDVPFYPQTDNYTMPDRTCNSSSCAMAAKYLGAKISGDDQYLGKVLEIGDTTDHNVQTRALEFYGIKSEWRTDLGFKDLDRQLAKGKPVVAGILHRGSEDAPTGGHIIVVIGKTEAGDYICNDPYGSLLDSYSSDVHNGSRAVYSRRVLTARWLVGGEGWGRIFA
jgi:lysozyme family protein